ncbi:YlxR family protein [Amycolatopsis sp.]|uniref:YlxR family protein n=1 Tax=Amycolatopsis sp. TaxID=37632 RepID=UPI002E0330B1|nr:YlxR family protein [Amycolatopsis sp.]
MVQDPRGGTTHQNHRPAPVRTCVGCRERALAGELLRVVAVDGQLVVDERRRLPGRGAWLHPRPGCLDKAERRRAFPRALRFTGILDGQVLRDHFERFAAVGGDGRVSPVQSESRKQVDPS